MTSSTIVRPTKARLWTTSHTYLLFDLPVPSHNANTPARKKIEHFSCRAFHAMRMLRQSNDRWWYEVQQFEAVPGRMSEAEMPEG
jgi:hypothetical protein